MHLVDRHGPVQDVAALPLGHPLVIGPREGGEVGDRSRGTRLVGLEAERDRVRLERQHRAVPADDLVLVARAQRDPGHEQLPEPVAGVQAHGLPAAVPSVPVADHADPPRVRRPHHEPHPVDTLVADGVGAESLEEAVVGALADQVQVVVGEGGREPVGVLDLGHVTVLVGDSKPVRQGQPTARHLALPEAGGVQQTERGGRAVGGHDRHRPGVGPEDPHADHALTARVGPEHREGITVLAGDESVDRFGMELSGRHDGRSCATRSSRASGVV